MFEALLLVVSAVTAAPGLAQEPVTVELLDGRRVSGAVDEKTNDVQLWLRRSLQGIEMSSGYNWDQITGGLVGVTEVDNNLLQTWAARSKTAGRSFNDLLKSANNAPRVTLTNTVTSRSPQTMVIEARLAQWDQDAQSDGLQVIVAPLDNRGQIVPVAGRLRLTLVTERENINSIRGIPHRPEFIETERISHEVHAADFQHGAAVYRLPFSKSHPDFQPDMAWAGLVHARLSVPGCCALEASDASVALREFSYLRDQLQLVTPGRYLPLESGGGPKR